MISPNNGNLLQAKSMTTTPRFIAALALAGGLISTSVNAADSSAYFRVDAGPVVVRDISVSSVVGVNTSGLKIQTKTGGGFRAVSGFNLDESFALELETGYQHSNFQRATMSGLSASASGGASVVPILVNGVLSGKFSESISADFGVGMGAAITTAELSSAGLSFAKQTKTSFMGQVKAGVGFKLDENVSANVSYRIGLINSPEFDSIKTESILTHMFTVGIGINF